MTLKDVQTILETTRLPVAYNSFTEEDIKAKGITLPFICWLNTGEDNFAADNKAYYGSHKIAVELYEEYRDETTEGKVETALQDIFYTKQMTYIDDEKMYEIIYEFEV